jgi:hypothetical protein
MRNFNARIVRSTACAACLLLCQCVLAQQSQPDNSAAAQAAPANAPRLTPPTSQTEEEQPKRIMGVMPNFRTVSAGQTLPKETLRDKLVTSTLDNFDYTSLFFAGAIAGISFGTETTPEFHQGVAGYGRYYWHTVADQSVENYFVELIVPAITHEDSRYYAMGTQGGSVWKRTGYSLSRVLITRKDSGAPTFNYSEITGSAAAASVSSFYYPSKERTVSNGLRNWGLDITYDAVTFTFHEFWPDISHKIFPGKHSSAAATP